MSKPSEEIVRAIEPFIWHSGAGASRRNADGSYSSGECFPDKVCSCNRPIRVQQAALAIDAAIQRAVERERGRCCRAVCKHCADGNEPRPARDYDQPMHLFQGYPPRVCAAAALRATPNTGG